MVSVGLWLLVSVAAAGGIAAVGTTFVLLAEAAVAGSLLERARSAEEANNEVAYPAACGNQVGVLLDSELSIRTMLCERLGEEEAAQFVMLLWKHAEDWAVRRQIVREFRKVYVPNAA